MSVGAVFSMPCKIGQSGSRSVGRMTRDGEEWNGMPKGDDDGDEIRMEACMHERSEE